MFPVLAQHLVYFAQVPAGVLSRKERRKQAIDEQLLRVYEPIQAIN